MDQKQKQTKNISNGKITIYNPVSDKPLVLFESPVAKKNISVVIGIFNMIVLNVCLVPPSMNSK